MATSNHTAANPLVQHPTHLAVFTRAPSRLPCMIALVRIWAKANTPDFKPFANTDTAGSSRSGFRMWCSTVWRATRAGHTYSSQWPNADLVMKMCEKRVLICDECEIGDGFSYQHIKRWTSNAPVSSGGRTVFLPQTLIVVSNKVPFYESRGEQQRREEARDIQHEEEPGFAEVRREERDRR
ncbi:hypothetical protein DL764_008121 [Monosporascus ibericus]|uniref:Uncharacterized protein n=1 Tax=Monosporascus ibericus TaxID=155417 RepID=A0A4Q4SYB2_9PEZI|nr:hypothetical protein DL764_008121 [Monosporascus ibericus]